MAFKNGLLLAGLRSNHSVDWLEIGSALIRPPRAVSEFKSY